MAERNAQPGQQAREELVRGQLQYGGRNLKLDQLKKSGSITDDEFLRLRARTRLAELAGEHMKSIVALSFAVLMSIIASEKAMAMPVAPLLAGFTESRLKRPGTVAGAIAGSPALSPLLAGRLGWRALRLRLDQRADVGPAGVSISSGQDDRRETFRPRP